MEDKRPDQADEYLRRLTAAVRSAQLYTARHPIIGRNIAALASTIETMHVSHPSVTIGIVGTQVVVGDVPVSKGDALGDVMRRLQTAGTERIAIERGVDRDELVAFVQALASVEPRKADGTPADFPSFAHIRVGRIQVEERVEGNLADMATIKRLYTDAVSVASGVWESATTEGKPDADAARAMIDGIAHAVAQNRPALVALTALKHYDNYTFTHMVNVSILTMAQARGLKIDGALLREFGLAALMHDIGKVRTPSEILSKPDKLTDEEFSIMKRHVVDGAEMLRQTPDIRSSSATSRHWATRSRCSTAASRR